MKKKKDKKRRRQICWRSLKASFVSLTQSPNIALYFIPRTDKNVQRGSPKRVGKNNAYFLLNHRRGCNYLPKKEKSRRCCNLFLTFYPRFSYFYIYFLITFLFIILQNNNNNILLLPTEIVLIIYIFVWDGDCICRSSGNEHTFKLKVYNK